MKLWLTRLFLVLVLLASSWALLKPGMFRVHDYIHAARIAEMTTALQQGQFPVRWSSNFGFGYGMPLFEFYAPLPFYVGSLFYWLGIGIIPSVKMLFFLAHLGTLMGGFFLGKQLFGRTGGLITATSLTLAPYRAVNLFVRGAVSEAWGIMALPWILYGIVLVIDEWASDQSAKKSGWKFVVFGLVTLMLSHNLTTMMFVPVSLVFGAVYGFWKFRSNLTQLHQPVLQLAGAYLLSIGLSAFYLFPALVEKNHTKIDSILGGYFHYSQHFLYLRQFWLPSWGYGGSEWGPNDGLSFFLGFGQWLGLMTVGVLVARLIWKLVKHRQWQQVWQRKEILLAGVFGGLLVATILMTTLKSQPIWDSIEFFSFIQFPWRWLGLSIVFVALLNGLAAVLLVKSSKRYLVAGVLLSMLVANAWYFRPNNTLDSPDELYYTDPARIQSQMSGILPDYIPSQMADELVPPAKVVWAESELRQEEVSVEIDRGHQLLLNTSLPTAQTLEIARADFPGWQVELDGELAPELKKAGQFGNIALELPAGQHSVGIFFSQTPIRRMSDILSAVSFILLMGVLISIPASRRSAGAVKA